MKYEISVKKILKANIHSVWDLIAAGAGVDLWFSEMIRSCDFNVDTKIRSCVMTNGAILNEKILLIDEEEKLFRYMITNHPLDATNLVATIFLKEVNDIDVLESTTITWSATFETCQENATEVKSALTHIYETGCNALASYLEQLTVEESNNA